MCEFKSGIIFKNRIELCDGENDSHSNLLELLGIENNYINANKVFVRTELVPIKGKWWTNPIDWRFIINQDIIPEWFEMDKEKYEEKFRKEVLVWWEKHVLVNKKIDKLSDGYYRLKGCEVKNLYNNGIVMLDNSTIRTMWDNSIVQNMGNNSIVQCMYGNSIIQKMSNGAVIQEMYDDSIVYKILANSTVQNMNHNSIIHEMKYNSIVQKMVDNTMIHMMFDNSTIIQMFDNSMARDCKDSTIKIIVPDENEEYEIIKHSNYK